MGKNKSLMEDPAQKIGMRLGNRRLRELNTRQIVATKEMTQPPVSVFSQEMFKMNEGVMPPLKVKADATMTPLNRTMGSRETQDFLRYSKRNVMVKSPTSNKVFIEPLKPHERAGPKF